MIESRSQHLCCARATVVKVLNGTVYTVFLAPRVLVAGDFLGTIRRRPALIHTDNGSNFAGRYTEIQSLQNVLKNEHAVSFQGEPVNMHMK